MLSTEVGSVGLKMKRDKDNKESMILLKPGD